jgi:transposase
MKQVERTAAIVLRRNGTSYKDIQERFGVAKSTVWRWLKQGFFRLFSG